MPRPVLLLVLWVACSGVVWGQSRGDDPSKGGDLDQARARWESMGPEERAEIKRRFERLRGLDAEQRKELERRHSSLKAAERQALEAAPEQVRAELEALPPREREQVVRELGRDALAERGRMARGELPAEVRARLEGADPQERRAILDELKRSNRGDRMFRVAEKLERDLGLPEDKRSRLEGLPPKERERRLFELHARRLERKVERDGLPEWIDPKEWERWGQLEPREFHDRLDRRSREQGQGGVLEAFGPRRGPGGRAGGPGGLGGPGGPGGPDLGKLMRPDPSWRLELRKLPHDERRAEIGRRVRERVLDHLRAQPEAVDPLELERLEQLEGEAFTEAVRELRGGGPRPRGDGQPFPDAKRDPRALPGSDSGGSGRPAPRRPDSRGPGPRGPGPQRRANDGRKRI